jgi:hypothetical protein
MSMKNKKTVLWLAVIVTAIIPACTQKYDDEKDFKAKPIDGGKGVEITEYVGEKWQIHIPPRIQNLPVTHIGDGAFQRRDLTSITIPDSVTTIGQEVFSGCESLTSVTIGNNVTSIGDRAFSSCKNLTNVTIPKKVTTIGQQAFVDCTSLTSVNIGNSVTTIGEKAFENNQLTSITIPNSVITIGDGAFAGGWDDDKKQPLGHLTKVTIGNSVTTIGDSAFLNNKLTSITIPNSVTTIGERAFESNQLTSVDIPGNVTTIGGSAFRDNSKLTVINVASGNTVYCSEEGVLFNNNKSILVAWPAGKTPVIIPSSVTAIGDYAFANSYLISITLPNSVTTIGKGTFFENQMTSITIPDSVTSIGVSAFLNNPLTNITIGADVATDKKYYSFPGHFDNTYTNNRRAAGTYTRPNTDSTRWSKK